jgi:glycerate-2-kinase
MLSQPWIGKVSDSMASAMEGILGDNLAEGFVITKYGHGRILDKIKILETGHPLPDEKSMEGARRLANIAGGADGQTLIINLVSGGGSALLCLPADGILETSDSALPFDPGVIG